MKIGNFGNVVLGAAMATFFVLLILVGAAQAQPSKNQAIKMWEGQYKGMVLDLIPRGGERTTNQLHNKHYITPVGTCWDYDVTELQKCGCRLFNKASICCRKGSSTDCEIRIGNSSLVDCSKYGKPKYRLSGVPSLKNARKFAHNLIVSKGRI